MRIKEVCQKTRLTDKAVRTYINEGLINPSFEENYMGRRTFNFKDEDIEQLKKIVILRKYNFSLKEIKLLFNKDISANELLTKHINEMKKDVNSDIDIINSMINVSAEAPDTEDELCKMLDTPEIAKKPIPVIDNTAPFRVMNEKLKKRNRLIIVFSAFIIIVIIVPAMLFLKSPFLLPLINNHSSSTDFTGFCIVESDTAEDVLNDIEKNYNLYTESIVLINDNLDVNDISNRFYNTNSRVINKSTEGEEYKLILIEAEYCPTKEYYKIMPILSTEEGESYTSLDLSTAWIENNGDFEYKSEQMVYSNGVFELDIVISEK